MKNLVFHFLIVKNIKQLSHIKNEPFDQVFKSPFLHQILLILARSYQKDKNQWRNGLGKAKSIISDG